MCRTLSTWLVLPLCTFLEQDNFSLLILAYLCSLEEYLLLPIADNEGIKRTLSNFTDGLSVEGNNV